MSSYAAITFQFGIAFGHDHSASFSADRGFVITRPEPSTVRLAHKERQHVVEVPWVHVKQALCAADAADAAAIVRGKVKGLATA